MNEIVKGWQTDERLYYKKEAKKRVEAARSVMDDAQRDLRRAGEELCRWNTIWGLCCGWIEATERPDKRLREEEKEDERIQKKKNHREKKQGEDDRQTLLRARIELRE